MIRPATLDDLPAVWELILELAEFERLRSEVTGSLEQLRAHFGSAFHLHVYECDGEIVAYALWFRNFSTFLTRPGIYLEDIYVRPTHRGGGIGKALLQHLIRFGRENGYGRVEWAVLDWNQSAIDFYEAQGATVMSEWRICRVVL